MKKIILWTMILIGTISATASNLIITTYQADFEQTIVNNSKKVIHYEGNILIKEPSKMLWSYTTPIEKYVYIDKKRVVIVEPDLEQAIFSRLDKEINILKLLKKAKKISNFKYEAIVQDVSYHIFITNGKLSKIKYKDVIENDITIKFTNINQNKSIDDKLFKYNIPYEYDVIRQD